MSCEDGDAGFTSTRDANYFDSGVKLAALMKLDSSTWLRLLYDKASQHGRSARGVVLPLATRLQLHGDHQGALFAFATSTDTVVRGT
jgi:hypothetical protein